MLLLQQLTALIDCKGCDPLKTMISENGRRQECVGFPDFPAATFTPFKICLSLGMRSIPGSGKPMKSVSVSLQTG